MVLLPALLLLCVVPLSSCSGRLETKFFLHEPQMQINDAVTACRYNYTDLVTIYDKTENINRVKMLNNLTGTNNCGWIGANSCTWSNGDPVIFINFTGDFTEERCCGALTTAGTWECFNCNSTMYFMCYKDYGQQSLILISENKTWFEAQKYCKRNHADLVSIRNETENERVKKAVKESNSVWIGLQYNDRLVWFDGEQSNYIKTFHPNDRGCFTFLLNEQMDFWYKHNKNTCYALCYKKFIHVSEVVISWEKGLDYCNTQPKTAGLLRIESEDDQTETEKELKKKNISGPVWVGLRQSRLFGFWIWSNGLNVGNWTNWKEGSEPEHHVSEHCGALQNVNGHYKWFDKDCRSKFRVLCEVK